jgi:adenosine deaminase
MMHKGELHVHFNGVVPTRTILDVVEDERTPIPAGFDVRKDLVHTSPCASLREYFKPWQLLGLVPKRPANLTRMIGSALNELSDNGVRFVEMRSTVIYLARLQDCAVATMLERIVESMRSEASARGMRAGLILTIPRGPQGVQHLDALLTAYVDIGRPSDIVGIDLAGEEEVPFPDGLPDRFKFAKHAYGLGVTIHAGETGNAANVRAAVDVFDADRIGHGTAAGSDPWIMDHLARRDVCIEVCPISNRLTGAVPQDQAHPLARFQAHGVPFVICSDNPAIHGRGLDEDFAVARQEGIDREVLQQQFEVAKRYSFIPTHP